MVDQCKQTKFHFQNNIASYFILFMDLAASFVGTPFNLLLSQLCQFINAYTNINDIHDINVHMEACMEAYLLILLLPSV